MNSDHYEMKDSFENKAKGQSKTYILTQKWLFKGGHFSDKNSPTEQHLRAYLKIGDEVKILLQAYKLLSHEQQEQGYHAKYYHYAWMIAIKR